ncbi:MAG: hypothetical protein CSA23_01530 [Deltaproteobacteria bacterium]|nr:MAG: hypothetical protein CSA23_01530 [Deltaproteobacteria bacterium]
MVASFLKVFGVLHSGASLVNPDDVRYCGGLCQCPVRPVKQPPGCFVFWCYRVYRFLPGKLYTPWLHKI